MGAIVAGANQAIKVRADRVFVKKMPTKFEASASEMSALIVEASLNKRVPGPER